MEELGKVARLACHRGEPAFKRKRVPYAGVACDGARRRLGRSIGFLVWQVDALRSGDRAGRGAFSIAECCRQLPLYRELWVGRDEVHAVRIDGYGSSISVDTKLSGLAAPAGDGTAKATRL